MFKDEKYKKEKRTKRLTTYYTETEDNVVTEAALIEGDAKAVFSRKSTLQKAYLVKRGYENE